MDKSDKAYKTIGEVTKILNFKTNDKGILPTYIIRFWETQFKQIKPKIFFITTSLFNFYRVEFL